MARYTNTLGYSGVRKLMTPYAASWHISLGDNHYKRASLQFDSGHYAVYEESDHHPAEIVVYKSGRAYNDNEALRVLHPETPFDMSDPIHAALFTINCHKGRGSIERVEWVNDRKGRYYVRLQYGAAVYEFRKDNGRIYARGTSVKLD